MGVKNVEVFRDSLLVTQQVTNVYQCFDGSLNTYLDKCIEIIALLDDFTVQHVFRVENTVANDLAQQSSGFWSNRGKLYVMENLDVMVSQTGCSGFRPMQSAWIYSTEPNSVKMDGPISKTEGSRISRSLDNLGKTTMIELDDWRTPLIRYIGNSGHIADRKVQRQALKYVMLDNTLYCQTMDGLLLKC
jgi:hypothetical protein